MAGARPKNTHRRRVSRGAVSRSFYVRDPDVHSCAWRFAASPAAQSQRDAKPSMQLAFSVTLAVYFKPSSVHLLALAGRRGPHRRPRDTTAGRRLLASPPSSERRPAAAAAAAATAAAAAPVAAAATVPSGSPGACWPRAGRQLGLASDSRGRGRGPATRSSDPRRACLQALARRRRRQPQVPRRQGLPRARAAAPRLLPRWPP
mmetsp:Transcript_105/g.275  ORF Transcript_105/g.275 Transcript_105/m.275 type:complete len:204 (-) Transcript_105:610-1221(-)